MKGWEQVPILVLGDAGLPDSEDYSNYPNYEPFAYRDRVLHHTDEDKKKAKSKRKSSPMKLSVV